jgi:HK97 family phage prohead protease
MTSAATEAGMRRLEAVLAAPPGPSRHEQVRELAQRYAREPTELVTKEVALAEPTAELTGAFTALVSDYGVDRTGERFAVGAWDGALAKLRASGKATPVLFGHSASDLHSVLGMVPADGWRADEQGLWAEGWLDVSDPIGQKIYRMLQSAALSWSIGFTLQKGGARQEGNVRVLEQVSEVMELSVTPLPANTGTRTVSAKAHVVPTLDELEERERALGLDDSGIYGKVVPADVLEEYDRSFHEMLNRVEMKAREVQARREID